ncbi:universal stress protein [Paucilactobacillus vaccinostercus]|jgi:nucleotide-binding universal stress UspA family protein|nr:universal stress protein [Paucilactobacillus vaccinostercus]
MMERYHKILVGIDGSEQSMDALHRAIDLGQALNASLLLVTVVDDRALAMAMSNTGNYVMAPNMREDLMAHAKETMKNYVSEATKAGIDFEDKVLVGDRKLELAENIPDKENVDAIVIGATGLTRMERVFIGSTASYIMNNAKCDVIIVK